MKTIWKFITNFYEWQSKQPPFMYILCLPFHLITIVYGICYCAYNIPKFLIMTIMGYWWCNDCDTRHHYWGKGPLDGKPKRFIFDDHLCKDCYTKAVLGFEEVKQEIRDEVKEAKRMRKSSIFDVDHAQVKAQHHKEDEFNQQGSS
jgi:hypothetical protein